MGEGRELSAVVIVRPRARSSCRIEAKASPAPPRKKSLRPNFDPIAPSTFALKGRIQDCSDVLESRDAMQKLPGLASQTGRPLPCYEKDSSVTGKFYLLTQSRQPISALTVTIVTLARELHVHRQTKWRIGATS